MPVINVDPVILATFTVYLLAMFVLGYIGYRNTANLEDYLLGGRRLGPAVTALSAGASDMSGWLLLGLPGYVYASGLEALWLVGGLWLGTYLNWRLVAQRLRQASHELNALTLPDFFAARFNDTGHALRIIAAICIVVFFTFYTASGLVAGGKLFNSVFGLPYHWAVVTGTTVIVIYTLFGGFLAVSWTDFLQGTLMLFALLLVPALAISEANAWSSFVPEIESVNPALLGVFTNNKGETLGLFAIVSLLAWGLGYFGQPHILARFMAIRSVTAMPVARRIAMGWVSLSMLGAVLAGLAGVLLFGGNLLADSEKIFIELIGRLLQPLPAGICLAAILAAIMSTADSQLLVASGSLSEDLYKTLLRRNASDREQVWTGRLGVILIATIAAWLARDPDSSVLDLVGYAWAGFGAAFGPLVLFALFYPGTTRSGAVAGMLTGALTVITWKQFDTGIFALYEMVPGFILATVAIVVVSKMSKA